MFQPRTKPHFAESKVSPSSGWEVYVDIDASEEGRTGGPRKTDDAMRTQEAMKLDSHLISPSAWIVEREPHDDTPRIVPRSSQAPPPCW